MKIYIMTHKKFKTVKVPDIYVPLLVGAEKNIVPSITLKDNSSKDNISYKNSNFCELTGAYWIWKNSTEDVVGICHYRRYFCATKHFFKKYTLLSEQKIKKILSKNDIIVPAKNNYEYNDRPSKEFFAEKHDLQVWDNCKEIISRISPEYLEDFEWFEKETSGYCYNMMIMSKSLFDNYHEWLFKILFQLEKITDIQKYEGYNVRMFGFISERLFNVWIHHKHLRVKEEYIYNPESLQYYQKIRRILVKWIEEKLK